MKKETSPNLTKEYQKSAFIATRIVGVALDSNGLDVEYHFFPTFNELKLIQPRTKTVITTELSDADLILLGKTADSEKQGVLSQILPSIIQDKNAFPKFKFDTTPREFMKDGFIQVPSKFLFNNQLTTDNIVITEDPTSKKMGILLIDRKLPPTGWAMAGGMVDAHAIEKAKALNVDAIHQNAKDELKEELNLDGVDIIPLSNKNSKVSTFEVRGSLTTTVSVFHAPDALRNKNASAGDDAADFAFITLNELSILLKDGKITKTINDVSKTIILVPHHAEILKHIFSPKTLKEEKNLSSLITRKPKPKNTQITKPKLK